MAVAGALFYWSGEKRRTKMLRKCVVLSVVMVMILSLFACGGGAPVEEEEEEVVEEELASAQDIIDGVIESFDNIRTYQFDMDKTMDTSGEAEGEAFERAVTMDNGG